MDEAKKLIIVPVIFFIGVSLGIWMALEYDGDLRTQAVQNQCARYHPETGMFEWIGEEK